MYESIRGEGGERGLCYAVSDSNHAGVEAAVIICIRDASQAISSTVDMVKPGEPRGQGAKCVAANGRRKEEGVSQEVTR